MAVEAAQLHGKKGENMHGNAFGLIKSYICFSNTKLKIGIAN